MIELLRQNKDALDVLVQVVLLVLPIVISWFIRTYVRASATQNKLASITRLANAAIDAIENLDKRGDLVLPPDAKKSGYKLKLASQWLESELNRNGIKVTTPDAEKWVASEFQRRVGGVRSVGTIAEVSREAVNLIQELGRNKVLDIPPDVDRSLYITGLGADWLVAKLAERGVAISHDEAVSWVRAEILARMGAQTGLVVSETQLEELARQAIAFVNQLKASGQLRVRPGPGLDEDIESDLAIAWALTEAAKQNLAVSTDQVAEVVATARQAQTSHALVVRPSA